MTTVWFINKFEGICGSKASVQRLRSHPSFTAFMARWSLPVYFQIRYQNLGSINFTLKPISFQSTKQYNWSTYVFPLTVCHFLKNKWLWSFTQSNISRGMLQNTECRMPNAERQMTLKFSDYGWEMEWIKFQVCFPSIMTLNGIWFTQFPKPTH